MEQMQTDEQIISNGTQPKSDRYDRVKRSLRIASGVVALFCIFASLASIGALFLVLRLFSKYGHFTTENQVAAIFGMIIWLALLIIGMVIVAISCLASGLLIITNKKNNLAKYIIASILGIFDIVAIVLIAVAGILALELNGGWYYLIVTPFAADLVLRIVCAVLSSVLKENQNG